MKHNLTTAKSNKLTTSIKVLHINRNVNAE